MKIMDEQKKTKVVNMKGAERQGNKLTYEQLNDACNQLYQQNQALAKRNRELEQFVVNKRLDYLFKVLEYSGKFNGDFIVSCTSEIEEAMTIPQEPKETKEEK